LGFGFWVLGFGFWVLGMGIYTQTQTQNPKILVKIVYRIKSIKNKNSKYENKREESEYWKNLA